MAEVREALARSLSLEFENGLSLSLHCREGPYVGNGERPLTEGKPEATTRNVHMPRLACTVLALRNGVNTGCRERGDVNGKGLIISLSYYDHDNGLSPCQPGSFPNSSSRLRMKTKV